MNLILSQAAKYLGQGLIQSVFELHDGSGVVVTIGKYITPNHMDINKNGVEPDFREFPGKFFYLVQIKTETINAPLNLWNVQLGVKLDNILQGAICYDVDRAQVCEAILIHFLLLPLGYLCIFF